MIVQQQNKQTKKKQRRQPDEYWQQESKRLRNQGYILKVRHERTFFKPILNQGSFAKHKVVATKRQFMKMIEEGKILKSGKGYRDTGYYIDSHAGLTTVSIFKQEKDELKEVGCGTAKVHKLDTFVRNIALAKAISAAVRDMEETNKLMQGLKKPEIKA